MTPDELNALADAATPGPWMGGTYYMQGAPDNLRYEVMDGAADLIVGTNMNEQNARLIALTPDIARLVAEMGEALEELSAEGWFASWSDDPRVVEIRAALAKLSELESR